MLHTCQEVCTEKDEHFEKSKVLQFPDISSSNSIDGVTQPLTCFFSTCRNLENTVLMRVTKLGGEGREETSLLGAPVSQRFNSFHLQHNNCLS